MKKKKNVDKIKAMARTNVKIENALLKEAFEHENLNHAITHSEFLSSQELIKRSKGKTKSMS